MDLQLIAVIVGVIVAVVGPIWFGLWRIVGRIDAVKDDVANLKSEVGYIKGRLDAIARPARSETE